MTKLNRRCFISRSVMVSFVLACRANSAPSANGGYQTSSPRQELPFDDDWRFFRADIAGAQTPDYDHTAWSRVSLPHDWSIEDLPLAPKTTAPWSPPAAVWNENPTEKTDPFALATIPPSSADGPPLRVGPFDAVASAGAGNTGWVVGGTAWYRKIFRIEGLRSNERVQIRFDGSFLETQVWLNGHYIGANIYGYGACIFDLTDYIESGQDNLLAVRVRNEGETSRWYSGSGLYRHVWLIRTGPIRIAPWGVFVSTPRLEKHDTEVLVAVEIDNALPATEPIDLRVEIRGPSGEVVANATSSITVSARGGANAVVKMRVSEPRLWSPNDPALYEAEVVLASGNSTLDRMTSRFGIRTIAASPERGLTINGVPIKLKGACIHADNGILGAAAIDRAEIRKAGLLKSYGYNAVRMGHQMFSPAFMDACDQTGMILISEVFDTWEQAKWLKNDYSRQFKNNWKNDITRMVRQNRNHPSVIFWSIGNEIPEAAEPRGVEIAAQLRQAVLELDSSRLITAAIANTFGAEGEPARRSLDVAGYNYALPHYEEDHKDYPHLMIMATEQYALDMHDGWRKAEAYPWLLGEFIWTGMDYLGEVGSGSSELRNIGTALPKVPVAFCLWDYPAYISGCGEIDINGGRKPQGLYRDVLWNRSALELLVQRPLPQGKYERLSDWGWHDELESWTWPQSDGRPMTVRAYTSGDSVKLVLNGRSAAERRVTVEDKLKAEFELPYEPGTLTAIAYRNGTEIGRKTLETVGAPAKLRLRAERTRIELSQNDLAYVHVEVCDSSGRRIPDAMSIVTFAATGAARLRATGSANPRGLKSFRSPECTTFHGEALAILEPSGQRGNCVLTASTPDAVSAQIEISVG